MGVGNNVGILILLVYPCVLSSAIQSSQPCPCPDSNLCRSLAIGERYEILIFSLTNNRSIWSQYAWNKVTTIVSFKEFSPELMCYAHSTNTRYVLLAGLSISDLTSNSSRNAWVAKNLKMLKDDFLDGLNIDFELPITQKQEALRDNFTDIVTNLYRQVRDYNRFVEISIDVAWSPDCIDLRCYSYQKLSQVTSLMFVMAYAEQSQMPEPCIARANSGFYKTVAGLRSYLDLINKRHLVLGIPWYGYDYTCLSLKKDVCSIEHVSFRGVNCSDAAGREVTYYEIQTKLINLSKTGRRLDIDTLSVYFNYKDEATGQMHQVWYDDPETLVYKYGAALGLDLRGIGVWFATALDYSNTTTALKIRKEMWGALPQFKKKFK